jgi:hypothetical protein
MNHSYEPNAFAFVEGRQVRVRSLKRINPREEITICFVDELDDVIVRQADLKESRWDGFSCPCMKPQLSSLILKFLTMEYRQ